MTDTATQLDQRAKFKELSDPIKNWLASVSLAYLIGSINKKLGLRDEKKVRVIPSSIWHLVTGDLAPQDFINNLASKLNLSFSSAKALAHEIEEKLLKPIEIPLRTDLGIDITVIHLAELSIKSETAPTNLPAISPLTLGTMPPTPVLPSITEKQWKKVETPPLAGQVATETRPSSLKTGSVTAAKPVEPLKPTGPAVIIKPVPTTEEPKPFILHEEVPPFTAAIPSIIKKIVKPVPKKESEPLIAVQPPVKKISPLTEKITSPQSEVKPPEIKSAPVRPNITTAKPPIKNQTAPTVTVPRPPIERSAPLPPIPTIKTDKNMVSRVIHYSSFKTPLDKNKLPEKPDANR